MFSKSNNLNIELRITIWFSQRIIPVKCCTIATETQSAHQKKKKKKTLILNELSKTKPDRKSIPMKWSRLKP